MGESLWLTDKFVDHPFQVICFGLFIIMIFTIFALYFQVYMPSPVTERDFLDYEDIITLLFDAREAAQGEVQEKRFRSGQVPL